MLVKNPKKRYTAEQVLKHPWIVENCKKGIGEMSFKFSQGKKVNQIIQRMKFQKYSPFKKLALSYLISILEMEATVDLRRGFEFLDKNQDGVIDI